MTKRLPVLAAAAFAFLWVGNGIAAEEREIAGVGFPGEKIVGGKKLELNGLACRRAFLVVRVYAGGLYLEHPTRNPQEAIESEQAKQIHLHYLTDRVTAARLRKGFIEAMERANPPQLVEAHRAEIQTYASWLDRDMAPGATSITTYVPGKGLTLTLEGELKGTIPGEEFARMYFRYNLGSEANTDLRKGYLGL
jgi:hypothetical protein